MGKGNPLKEQLSEGAIPMGQVAQRGGVITNGTRNRVIVHNTFTDVGENNYRVKSLELRAQYIRTVYPIDEIGTCRVWRLQSASDIFIGREELLKMMSATLANTDSAFRGFYLDGMPGLGKTSTGIAFCRSHTDKFSRIGFIDAETDLLPRVVDYLLADEIDQIELPKRMQSERLIQAIFARWQEADRGLALIFLDNVKDPKDAISLIKLAEPYSSVRFLITSRKGPGLNDGFKSLRRNKQEVNFTTFTETEAVQFIDSSIKKNAEAILESLDDDNDSEKRKIEDYIRKIDEIKSDLVRKLYFYPLALGNAVTYLKNMGDINARDLGEFMYGLSDKDSTAFANSVFDKQTREIDAIMADETKEDDVKVNEKRQVARTAFTVLWIIYKQAFAKNKDILQAVKLCVFLSESPIHRKVLQEYYHNASKANVSIQDLLDAGLVKKSDDGNFINMHGFTQFAMRALLIESQSEDFCQILKFIDQQFHVRVDEKAKWQYWNDMLPHVEKILALSDHLIKPARQIDENIYIYIARICFHLSVFHKINGEHDNARKFIDKALVKLPKTQHYLKAKYSLLSSEICLEKGELEQALNIYNSIKNHADVKTGKLALRCASVAIRLFERKGDFAEALHNASIAYKLAKTIYEGIRIEKYIDVIYEVIDVHIFAGSVVEAEKLLGEAKILSETHSLDAIRQMRLARCYADYYKFMGNYSAAIAHAKQAKNFADNFNQKGSEQEIKANIHSLNCLVILAICYSASNQLAEARSILQHAEKIVRDLYGSMNNISGSLVLVYLGDVYKQEQNYKNALSFYSQSMAIAKPLYEQTLTREIAVRYQRLADAHMGLEEISDAMDMQLKACEIFEKIGIDKNPDEYVRAAQAMIFFAQQGGGAKHAELLARYHYTLESMCSYDSLSRHNLFSIFVTLYHFYKDKNDKNAQAHYAHKVEESYSHLDAVVNSDSVHRQAGYVLECQGDLDKALKCYQVDMSLRSPDASENIELRNARCNIARVYFAQEDYAQALEQYKIAWGLTKKFTVNAKPEVTGTIDKILDCYVKLDAWDDCITFIENAGEGAASQMQAANIQSYFYKCAADRHYKLKKYEWAVKFYRLYFSILYDVDLTNQDRINNNLKTQSTIFFARRNLINAHLALEQPKEAIEHLDSVLLQLELFENASEPYEIAKKNLMLFCLQIGIDAEFDENKTCIFGINDDFSLHLTFEPNANKLYLYAPLLDGLPKNEQNLLSLYQSLLEKSMLGKDLIGGGVGVAVKEEVILVHNALDMTDKNPFALIEFSQKFVALVESLRLQCKYITRGMPVHDVKNQISSEEPTIKMWLEQCHEALQSNPAFAQTDAAASLLQRLTINSQHSLSCEQEAERQLKEVGKTLGMPDLSFDENNTSILAIDGKFSLHITYEPRRSLIYLYSPLLDELPEGELAKLKLYERLLSNAMLGGQVAAGGVGLAVAEGLILMHSTVALHHSSDALERFIAIFVDAVEENRAQCQNIIRRYQSGRHDNWRALIHEMPPYILSENDTVTRYADKIENLKRRAHGLSGQDMRVNRMNCFARISVHAVALSDLGTAEKYIGQALAVLDEPCSSKKALSRRECDEVNWSAVWVYCNLAFSAGNDNQLIDYLKFACRYSDDISLLRRYIYHASLGKNLRLRSLQNSSETGIVLLLADVSAADHFNDNTIRFYINKILHAPCLSSFYQNGRFDICREILRQVDAEKILEIYCAIKAITTVSINALSPDDNYNLASLFALSHASASLQYFIKAKNSSPDIAVSLKYAIFLTYLNARKWPLEYYLSLIEHLEQNKPVVSVTFSDYELTLLDNKLAAVLCHQALNWHQVVSVAYYMSIFCAIKLSEFHLADTLRSKMKQHAENYHSALSEYLLKLSDTLVEQSSVPKALLADNMPMQDPVHADKSQYCFYAYKK